MNVKTCLLKLLGESSGSRELIEITKENILLFASKLPPDDFKRLLGELLSLGLTINDFSYPSGVWPPPTPARRYISSFLQRYAEAVKGRCLEFNPPVYKSFFRTNRKVSIYDVWNVTEGEGISVVGDLQNAPHVPDNLYDSIICTHVLSAIPEPAKAVAEMQRILKPGGIILCTVPCVLQRYAPDPKDCWRFTVDSLSHLFSGFSKCVIHSFGNAAMVAGSPYYLMTNHFPEATLDYHDDNSPSIVAAAVWKRR